MRHQKSKRLARKGNASDRTQTCQLITSNFSPSPFGSRSYRHEDSPAHPSPHLKIPYLDQIQTEGGSCYTGRNPYRDGITIAMPPEIPITFVLGFKVEVRRSV